MRRLTIAISVSIAILALAPTAGMARGPQKNDSVNGHGFVVVTPTFTEEFRVSAHTLSSTTTAATGNMFVRDVFTDAGGTTTISYWADVFCVSVLGVEAEVRGHIYRTEPDVLGAPTDLVFNVVDLSPATSAPDLFFSPLAPVGGICGDSLPPPVFPVAKGSITVNDEGP